MKRTDTRQILWGISTLVILFVVLVMPTTARMQDIQTSTQVSAPRIAPGESMPVSVKLSNFGSSARTDVVVTYDVLSVGGRVVETENETYAVETTASWIRTITVPTDITPGQYTVRVSIAYTDQKAPAVASYPFAVERKVAGIFVSDLIMYGSIAFVCTLLASLLLWFMTRRRLSVMMQHDYSSVPREARVYYEVIGAIIREMRIHAGDQALVMAADIPGLTINRDTGRVLHLTGDPAEVVASIVSNYEKKFGKHVNLGFGKNVKERARVR